MIRDLLKRALAVAALWLLKRYEQTALDLIKIRAAVYYVKAVQGARMAAMGFLALLGAIALVGAGLVILPVGLAVLLYVLLHSWIAPCVVLLVMGALYVIAPLYIVHRFLSERAWMRIFKVDDIIDRATGKPREE
jgi:hypothetical protein